MADQPIKLFGHEIHNGFITGLTEDGAHVTAAIKTHVGDVVHTTEHVFHLQPKVEPKMIYGIDPGKELEKVAERLIDGKAEYVPHEEVEAEIG